MPIAIQKQQINYDFNAKNQWRRRIWNEVLRRTKHSHRRDVVLYLAGPEGYDRDVAISKGVPTHNLIAVDLCLDNVLRIRKEGGLAIEGNLVDVLKSWPEHTGISAVMADFCNGVNQDVRDLHRILLTHRPMYGSVLMLNLLRGRDGWWTTTREVIENFSAVWEHAAPETHRVAQWYYFNVLSDVVGKYERSDGLNPQDAWNEVLRTGAEDVASHIKLVDKITQPWFDSYQTYPAKRVMDSGVFTMPRVEHKCTCEGCTGTPGGVKPEPVDSVRGRISATLAHRTMRLRKK